jgi:hypothetical protein
MAQEQIFDSNLLQLEGTGMTAQAVTVGDKEYALHLPSIVSIQKVAEYLAEMVVPEMNNKTLDEAVRMMTNSKMMARCVSFIIQGDETLTEELESGSVDELQEVIILYHQMTIRSMMTLKALAHNIGKLIGKQK